MRILTPTRADRRQATLDETRSDPIFGFVVIKIQSRNDRSWKLSRGDSHVRIKRLSIASVCCRSASRLICKALAVGATAALSVVGTLAPIAAQTYPSRPVTIIVPFAPGGAADVNGRVIADALSQRLGQTFIVENIAGAGGTTGSVRGKNAPADGYTLLLGHMGTQAAAVALYPKLLYDPRTDFEPIGLISFSPIVLFARKDLPANNLREFLELAKAKGSQLTDGHSGVGSISHITCVMLSAIGGFKPTFVPYRGVGPMMNDMLGGNVDFGCDLVLAASPQIANGGLKGIAVAASERSPAIPSVPTAAEGGLADFRADAWSGLFAPKGTPPAVLATLRDALAASLDDAAVRTRLTQLGAVIPRPEERRSRFLSDLVRTEVDRWGKVIREAGITLE